jgi:hypothetical protein
MASRTAWQVRNISLGVSIVSAVTAFVTTITLFSVVSVIAAGVFLFITVRNPVRGRTPSLFEDRGSSDAK